MEEVNLKLSVDGYAPVSVNADAFDAKPSSVDIVRENGRKYIVSIKFEKAPKCLCGKIVNCDVPYNVTELRLPDSIKSITTPLDWLIIDKKEDINLHKSLLTADGNLIVCNNKVLRQIGKESVITIPEGITVIGKGAFKDKKDLTKVEFSKTIETIEEKAFSGCFYLPVKLPRNVKTLGDYAFEGCGCDKGAKLNITSKVTRIGNFAFKGCERLTSVKIPNSVEEIGQGAFAAADRIKFFEGKGVLADCRLLIWNNRLVSYALDGEWLKHDEIELPEGIEEIGDWAISYNDPGKHWRCISTLPGSIKRIGDHALVACGMNSKLVIPDSVEEIGEGAFSEDITVSGKFVDENGNLICNDTLIFKNGLGQQSVGYGLDFIEHPEVRVPDGVKRIGSFANIHAEKIVIPEGVESIGEKAIRVSKHISLPSTLKRIEGHGLRCRELCEEPSFPTGLISIDTTLEEIRTYSVSFKSNPPECQGYNHNALIVVPEEKFELYKDAYSGVVSGDFFYGGIAFRDEKGGLHFEKLTPEETAQKEEEMASFWSEFEALAPSNETFDALLEEYAHGVIKENGESFYFIDILPEYLRIELRYNKTQRLCACTLHELQKVEKYEGIHFFAFNQATGFTRSYDRITNMKEENTSNCVYFKTPSGLRNNGIAWKLPEDMDAVGIYALLYTAAVIQVEKMLPLLNPKDE